MSEIGRYIEDRSFTPEQLEVITTAFEAVCRDLGQVGRDDPLVEIIARVIVEVAARGDWGWEEIRRSALERMTAFDADHAAMVVLAAAISLARADFGNIQRYHAADRSLTIIAQQGFDEGFLRTFERVAVDDSCACARAMRDRRPILIEDVSIDAPFRPYREVAKRAGFLSVASVPLVTSSTEFIGVLSVHFASTRSLGNDAIQSLRDYAGHAANALVGPFSLRS